MSNGLLALLLLAVPSVFADGAQPVPHAESFESQLVGSSITAVAGWSAAFPDDATISTNAEALAALTNYFAGGGSAPLAGGHTQVLALAAAARLQLQLRPTGLVRTDLLLRPWSSGVPPPVDTNLQLALSYSHTGSAMVLHRNGVTQSNEWLTLAAAPPVASGAWVRVTILKDYRLNRYQVAFDGAAPVTNAAGWNDTGDAQPGSWFYMVKTNGFLTRVELANDTHTFLDDLEIQDERPDIVTQPTTNVSLGGAALPGRLAFTGLAPTAVEVYWGTIDGGTNAAAWAHTNRWAAPQVPGDFVHPVSNLAATLYHYRYAATNAYGRAWSDHTATLLPANAGSLSGVTWDSQAGERPPDSGMFRVYRPAGATNGALKVYYSTSGSASNGVDYLALSGVATFAAGSTYTEIPVVPIRDAVFGEPDEEVYLEILPGPYVVGSQSPVPITITDAADVTLLWKNTSGDFHWNSTSSNWFSDPLFFPFDNVEFDVNGAGVIFIGSGATPVDAPVGRMTVINGAFEFNGGTVLGGPVEVRTGGRIIDRNLGRTGFGGSTITLNGGSFWRQIPPDDVARTPTFTNALVVTTVGGTVQGGRGANTWSGAVDLRGRLSIGSTAGGVGNVNNFTGPLTINQDTNFTAARTVALRVGGGLAYLDGPIVDDPDTNHTGAFPLTLGLEALTSSLVLRGANTYTCGTLVTTFGGTTADVIVGAGSSLGTGPITLSGAGARLTVQTPGVVLHPLTIPSGVVVTLTADGAVTAAAGSVTANNGGLLRLYSGNCLPDEGVLNLGASGQVHIEGAIEEAIGDLYINGVRQLSGIYTAVELPVNILGTGALRVRGPIPTGLIMLVR